MSSLVYRRFLLCVAGLGGLLYGIDVGIISAALLYLSKTVDLTVGQTSAIVAAVLGGSMLSSLIAGVLADWFGRRTMMIVSGSLFLLSVALIVASHGFVPLFLGRLLQGMSGGVIAVVVPLYLAESLSAETRGRGSAVFQFMLTFGIVLAALIGSWYIHRAEGAIAQAAGNLTLIHQAQDQAWRGMFLAVIYPGVLFCAGSLLLSETPRWLFQHGRPDEARRALMRSVSSDEAALEMDEMRARKQEAEDLRRVGADSLLKRKYLFPFLLACTVLTLNQSTGINSILAYLVTILRQAGMSPDHATQGDLAVKTLNCVVTIIAVVLIDKKGRKVLLSVGTGGIVISLLMLTILFRGFEAHRVDLRTEVQNCVREDRLAVSPAMLRMWTFGNSGSSELTLLYTYGKGDKLVTLTTSDGDDLRVQPGDEVTHGPLTIEHAFLGPVPSARTGWLGTLCLGLFIASYSVGPGVVVWLALSELMPTRIRSVGMGVALLLNQGVSTLIAGIFLPVVARFGYYAMFLSWAACTSLYFLTAVFLLPETKGKTLEEIERYFDPA